jgi:peptide-methionine (S)-S-oxide reductase
VRRRPVGVTRARSTHLRCGYRSQKLDPERISYRDILEYFFQIHRADLGEDVVGSLYRSEIFYTTEEQRRVAQETIPDVDAARIWPGKVVTRISKAGPFWESDCVEDQGYFQTPPGRLHLPPPA